MLSMKFLDTRNIAVGSNGQVVLSDDDLSLLENDRQNTEMAGGSFWGTLFPNAGCQNTGNCAGSNNTACTNATSCSGSSNGKTCTG